MIIQKKVLIIAPSWVGDMIMAQSLMIALKQQNAEVIIDVLAPSWTQALTSRMTEVNRTIISPFKHGVLGLVDRIKLGKILKLNAYDEAYVLPNSFKSAWVPFFAAIPKRIGWCGELRFGLLNDLRFLNKKSYPLMVQRFAALAYPFNAPEGKIIQYPKLTVISSQVEATLSFFGLTIHSKKNQKIMALSPGAEFGPSKRWPEEHFSELVKALHNQGWIIWLFGSEKDKPIARTILEKSGIECIDFVGKTSLDQAIDLLSVVDCLVTNDSGLMHIACALDKPVVAIYGSTSTEFTPPLALSKKVQIVKLSLPCSPCFKRVCPLKHHRHHQCMRDIIPNTVISAVDKICAY